MQEIAKRPYYQKPFKDDNRQTQTLNQTVISPDCGSINRRRCGVKNNGSCIRKQALPPSQANEIDLPDKRDLRITAKFNRV
ncbi:hypothetical protein GEW_12501 [Pasteurella multocida subsp. gallicida str. Anand1_poultry]|nr:hypothetical protein GEW_12501 [Pasteurella multocida subsp. gallicida str. Anand1_poultry]